MQAEKKLLYSTWNKSIKEIINQVVVQEAYSSHDDIQGHRNKTLTSHNAQPTENSKAEEWRIDTAETKI